jgi:hypothetical protein
MRNRTLITLGLIIVCALGPIVLTRAESGRAPASQSASALANGHAWVASSMDQKRAYLLGVSDPMRVAIAYREKHGGNESKQQEMIGILDRSLGQVHMSQVIARVNAFYGRSGADLNTPVLVVIWREFVKPNLNKSK